MVSNFESDWARGDCDDTGVARIDDSEFFVFFFIKKLKKLILELFGQR